MDFKKLTVGTVCIKATYNNTIITITDTDGNTIASSSAGQIGFKGSKKSTPFAGGETVKNAMEKARAKANLQKVYINVTGFGNGRDTAIKTIASLGITAIQLKDRTPIPHNGCRKPKKPQT